MNKTFQDVVLTDPYVHSIMHQGGTTEMCVVELANQKNELLKRVIELETTTPRQYVLSERLAGCFTHSHCVKQPHE